MASKVPALIIAERDAVMYEMKKSGANYRQIAKHFDVSEATAYRGVTRMQERIRDRMALDHSAEARLDLDRMDDMLRGLIPMTRPSKMEVDGVEIPIPPSLDAIDRVMKIIGQRSKFFGYDKGESLSITVQTGSGGPSTAKEDTKSKETTPEDEVKGLLEVFKDAGIMDEEAIAAIQNLLGVEDLDDVVDAEIVNEEAEAMAAYDPVAIDPVRHVKPSEEPPEFVDDYDEEFPDG